MPTPKIADITLGRRELSLKISYQLLDSVLCKNNIESCICLLILIIFKFDLLLAYVITDNTIQTE